MKVNPLNQIDFYKADHRSQYPEGTELVFSNLTPRRSIDGKVEEIVFFGLQYFIKEYLIFKWNKYFFEEPKEKVINDYKRRIETSLGKDAITFEHVEALHDLGYLPIEIRALPEGSRVPVKVPVLVIYNTKPEFFWLTNYLETILSCVLWGACTSATTADRYRQMLNYYADLTVGSREFVQWQGHDFSFRGMFGFEAACISGAGHLLSFTGTDTIPAIDFHENYYNANSENELIGASVPATEHSVMCMGSEENEMETFKRLISETYPNGIVSIVSDSWDFWRVVTEYLPELKDMIMARDGKVVIRPDSGDPVKIICGDKDAKVGSPEYSGAVELIWNIFGGTVTDKGFKQLDSHIGLIYGDSITLDRCEQICKQLHDKGFASTNLIFGIGSYTYQYVTRDSLGFAMKATYGEVSGQPKEIFKKPVTDKGSKTSAKGLIAVDDSNGRYSLSDGVSWDRVRSCKLETVFKDGKLIKEHTLSQIRKNLGNV